MEQLPEYTGYINDLWDSLESEYQEDRESAKKALAIETKRPTFGSTLDQWMEFFVNGGRPAYQWEANLLAFVEPIRRDFKPSKETRCGELCLIFSMPVVGSPRWFTIGQWSIVVEKPEPEETNWRYSIGTDGFGFWVEAHELHFAIKAIEMAAVYNA